MTLAITDAELAAIGVEPKPKSKGAPKAVAKPVPANSPQAAKGAKAAKPEKVDGRGRVDRIA